jgi:hypothetical protein
MSNATSVSSMRWSVDLLILSLDAARALLSSQAINQGQPDPRADLLQLFTHTAHGQRSRHHRAAGRLAAGAVAPNDLVPGQAALSDSSVPAFRRHHRCLMALRRFIGGAEKELSSGCGKGRKQLFQS